MNIVMRTSSQRRDRLGIAALGAVAVILGTIVTFSDSSDAQQSQPGQTEPTGEARVIEKRGPEVEIRQNGRAQVVVMFPGATQSSGQPAQGGKDIQVVLVESQVPQAGSGEGQPQPSAQPQATGREVLFSSRDASRGVVRYSLDPTGNGRRMMVLAKIDGLPIEVKQAGGSEGVQVFSVAPPPKPQSPTAQNPGQPIAGSDQASTDGTSAGGAAQPAPAQPQQPPRQPPIPEQAAIIIIYTGEAQP